MAQIVLGLGTSHSPQLSTPPDVWPQHAERDQRNPDLRAPDGRVYSYDELVSRANPDLRQELTPEVWQARYDACQRGIARLRQTLAEIAPDVLVMIGDDQDELFYDDNMPALLVYWGEAIRSIPRDRQRLAPGLQAAAWAYGETEQEHPVASDLAKHIVTCLIDEDFDVAHSRRLPEGQGMGHAFSFIYGRIMPEQVIPAIPVMLNTYYPPNQPTPRRCYALGQALRRAIEGWLGTSRVAVVASGGMSHFVIDEELDRQALNAMQDKNAAALAMLPRERLNSGNSEIRNWIAVAGAVEHLGMQLIDYVPCYRSPAGTGCAMAFAQWM